jgi:hypothetical protein
MVMFEDINNLADREESDATAQAEAAKYLSDRRLMPAKEVESLLDLRCQNAATKMWDFGQRIETTSILDELHTSITRLQAFRGAVLDYTPFFWRPKPQSMRGYADGILQFQPVETCAVAGYLLNWRDCGLGPTILAFFKNQGESREDPVSVAVVPQSQSLTSVWSLKSASIDAMFSEGVDTIRWLTLREVLDFAKEGYRTSTWRGCSAYSPGPYQSAAVYYMACVFAGSGLSPLREAYALHLLRRGYYQPLAQVLGVPEWPVDAASLKRSRAAAAGKKLKVRVENRFSDSHDTERITEHQYEALNKRSDEMLKSIDPLPQYRHPPFCYRSSRYTAAVQAAFELPTAAIDGSKPTKGGMIGRQAVVLDVESSQGLAGAKSAVAKLLESTYTNQLVGR